MPFVNAISSVAGIPEDALRFLLAMLIGYPISYIYRTQLYNRPKETQLAYFALTGSVIMLWICGWEIWHSLIDIGAAFLIVQYMAGTRESIIAAFTWFLGHLLAGYWFHESHEYDIGWTTPHCILCLRLIGLVYDVYDGHNDPKLVMALQKDNLITDKPTLLEIVAYTYFPTACLGGPQFPLNRLRKFISGGMLEPKSGKPREVMIPMLKRVLPAIIYMAAYTIGHAAYPNSYMYSDAYVNQSFGIKLWENFLWFRFIIARYMGFWLLVEGSNILSGFAYNEDSDDKWDGVRDFHISRWELGTNFNSYVVSFNFNTNQWVGRYVFRRLKWLNAKMASHMTTLLFLAVWHGYHLGYFMLFIFEFACLHGENQLQSLIDRVSALSAFFAKPPGQYLQYAFGRVVVHMFCAVGFFTFGLVKKERWWIASKSVYFYPQIIMFVLWPIAFELLRRAIPRAPRTQNKETEAKKEL